jgi:outer membrane protein assembly factor BamB
VLLARRVETKGKSEPALNGTNMGGRISGTLGLFALSLVTGALSAACSNVPSSVHTAAPSQLLLKASHTTEISWPVWGFDPARSDYNSSEETLTVKNVNQLREQWQTTLGRGPVDSAPILVASPGGSQQPMLFETTKKGVTFGINATSGSIVWKFSTTGGKSTTSAPAADPSSQWVYAPGVDGKVHKLDASNGYEVQSGGFPVTVSLMPETELEESPLNVANGYLYATLAGDATDHPPYVGHVVSVNLSNGTVTIFNSLCSNIRELLGPSSCAQQRSGIWSRGGAVVDPDPSMSGNIYVATGNGDFDANVGGYDYGDSVIALSADLSTIVGNYTPADYVELDDDNLDLGSTSPAMLPRQPKSQTPLMMVQGGKDAVLRLVNRAALPGVGGELQVIHLRRRLYSSPAVWTDSQGYAWIFLGTQDRVLAYRLATKASGVSRLVFKWSANPGTSNRGTSPVVANGILFVAFNGVLVALDAQTGKELWSSTMSSAGGTIGPIHFESPIVVNGWVYCSDQHGKITAYALPASTVRRH